MLETEIESLKNNLEKTKKDSLSTEEKHLEALRYWQKQVKRFYVFSSTI